MKVGCILQAHHKLPPSPFDNEPLDSPEAIERLKQRSQEPDTSRIVTIAISEAQARAIVNGLWPNEGLLGATCGRGFEIENEAQASVVNEIMLPHVRINFNLEKHIWMLQTWPED